MEQSLQQRRDAKELAENVWAQSLSLDSVLLDASNELISINGVSRAQLSQKYLRRFCVMFKITGYKNQKRDQIMQLIVRRVQATALENMLYPDEDLETGVLPLSEAARGQDHIDGAGEDDSTEDAADDDDNQQSVAAAADDDDQQSVTAISRTAARAAPRKKKKSKSTPPTSITQVGTYIRATNVFFDQLHRADVSSLGEPPTMRDLDTRQFRNKGVYDKLLVTYLDASIEHIGFAGFTGNVYLEAMGLTDDIGMNFDVLTSEELSDTMSYLNHHYRLSHRDNQKSGNHANFEDFVKDKPYIYYYHLWLGAVPHLLSLAVPSLPGAVSRDSSIPTQHQDVNPSLPLDFGSNNRRGRKNATDTVAKAMQELGRASSEKVALMRAVATERADAKRVSQQAKDEDRLALMHRNAVKKETDLLLLMEKYDSSLKAKREELDGYASDATEAEETKLVIAMLKTKRRRTLESLQSTDL
jgi:hypothetical protein